MARIKRHHGDRLLMATFILGIILLAIGLSLPYLMNSITHTEVFTTNYGCAKCAPGTACPDFCIAMPTQYASTIIAVQIVRFILLISGIIMIALSIAAKLAAHMKK